MKTFLITTLALLLSLWAKAQAPQQFSFQGVARDATGKAISNATIGLRLTIHSDVTIGPTVYQETHNASTGAGGIFTVKIGTGAVQSGVFTDIKWESKSYFLQVEVDPAGGINYINMGATQILSVPYALHAAEAARWTDEIPIVQKVKDVDLAPVLPTNDLGSTLIWYPKKSAFRAGYIESDSWNDPNIGSASVAFGTNTKASGLYSMAANYNTQAIGQGSFAIGAGTIADNSNSFAAGASSHAAGGVSAAMGYGTLAKGFVSFATGNGSKALGYYSFSAGNGTVSKANSSATFGSYNDTQDNPGVSYDLSPDDRIFQIGNGSSADVLSNALTILRSGRVGIGNGALMPQYILDVDGRMRIRHNQGTAGLWLNNSQQQANTFMGMQSDISAGIYLGDQWRFTVNNVGQGYLNGSLIQTSDRRLKKDFSMLTNSLSKINLTQGYHFYWKDPAMDPAMQTGLIAQDVENIFPELVTTNSKGFKAVNYIGFIPHLIESVKALKKENDDLKKSISQLSALEARVSTLTDLLQRLSQKDESAPTHTK